MRKRFYAPSGSRTVDVFKNEFVNGRKVLKKVGESDIYARIQEGKDDCDVYKILDRFTNGDLLSLQRRVDGIFADVSAVPTSMVEFGAYAEKARDNFYKLPLEIRDAFGNDIDRFLAASENEETFKKPFLEFYEKLGVKFDTSKVENSTDKEEKTE